MGDELRYETLITGSSPDEAPVDNLFVLEQEVVSSFDPNDKTCLEGDVIAPSSVGKYLHYLIRFENTGNFAAENIVVKDMIDAAVFDVSSLVTMNASHPVVTRISEGNKVEFIFENINLPFDDANNDGYVAFKIKTRPTLVVGNTITNAAGIYFDYNQPVITDPAVTTVELLGTQDFAFSDYFTIWPNPAQDVLHIEPKKGDVISSVQIYNTIGQLLQTITDVQPAAPINTTQLQTGNYFLKVQSSKGASYTQFVKR